MRAVDALLTGLVDYAGLFPPASQDMRSALESYAFYAESADRSALGRFIVPIGRLAELEEGGRDLLPRGADSEPWRLSVLVGEGVRSAGEQMLKFNCHHWSGSEDGHAVIDAAELKASTTEEIQRQRAGLPRFFTAYFEIPISGDVSSLMKAIAEAGARAKVRTGGVTVDAFPRSGKLLDFIVGCRRERVPFKATAGLHHAIRGSYRLTYEPNSPAGTMYGFLNVFLAAALVWAGDDEATALALLEERDASALVFSDDAITWRGRRITAEELRASRDAFAISFGSCSFREPVDELARLTSAHAR